MNKLEKIDRQIAVLVKERNKLRPLQQLTCRACSARKQVRSIDVIQEEVYEDHGSPNGAELRFTNFYFVCPACGHRNCEDDERFKKFLKTFSRGCFKSCTNEIRRSF